jgi:hypothetical protein
MTKTKRVRSEYEIRDFTRVDSWLMKFTMSYNELPLGGDRELLVLNRLKTTFSFGWRQPQDVSQHITSSTSQLMLQMHDRKYHKGNPVYMSLKVFLFIYFWDIKWWELSTIHYINQQFFSDFQYLKKCYIIIHSKG